MSHHHKTVETTDSKPQEDWMARRWRPAMGWLYMTVCACDFIVFPVLWSLTQAVYHIIPFVQWQPLTLQGAGLFHLAMGAVLGIAAYGRTKEKMAGAEQGGLSSVPDLSQGFGPGAGTTYTPPGMNGMQSGMNNGMNGSYGGSSNQFNTSYGGNTNQFNSTPNNFSAPPSSFGSAPSTITQSPPPAFGSKPSGPSQTFPPL